jgi:hypothetical protein
VSFLNPLLLFGLVGMAVPVVIHLLSRRTARRVEFSSLDFLRDLEKKSLRRLRARQLLLLLVRMVLVGCVAVAMARPVLSGAGGGARGSTSAVVILDGSHSMTARHDGRTLFDAARDRAGEVLEAFETGDEVTLLVPGGADESQARSVRDPELVRERIATARPGAGAADLTAAVADAAALLEDARHVAREIHVEEEVERNEASWAGARAVEAVQRRARGSEERLPLL